MRRFRVLLTSAPRALELLEREPGMAREDAEFGYKAARDDYPDAARDDYPDAARYESDWRDNNRRFACTEIRSADL